MTTTVPAIAQMLDWQKAHAGKLHYSETASTRLHSATATDLLTPTDCSGNFARLMKFFGHIDVGTYTGNICDHGTLVTISKADARVGKGLLPGDGILFDWNGDGHWDHIAMVADSKHIWNHGGPNFNDMGPDLWSLADNVDNAHAVMVRRYIQPTTVDAPSVVTHTQEDDVITDADIDKIADAVVAKLFDPKTVLADDAAPHATHSFRFWLTAATRNTQKLVGALVPPVKK